MLKPMVKTQIQTIIKPYLEFIPLLLAALFFLTFESLIALAGPLISLISWITFGICLLAIIVIGGEWLGVLPNFNFSSVQSVHYALVELDIDVLMLAS